MQHQCQWHACCLFILYQYQRHVHCLSCGISTNVVLTVSLAASVVHGRWEKLESKTLLPFCGCPDFSTLFYCSRVSPFYSGTACCGLDLKRLLKFYVIKMWFPERWYWEVEGASRFLMEASLASVNMVLKEGVKPSSLLSLSLPSQKVNGFAWLCALAIMSSY